MTALAATLFTALLALHLATVAIAASRYLRKAPAAPLRRPPVTVLRPVCGLDRFDAETLESTFLLNYPDYEILFCAAAAEDPACAAVRAMMARHPNQRARLLVVPMAAITSVPVRRSGEVPFTSSLMCIP